VKHATALLIAQSVHQIITFSTRRHVCKIVQEECMGNLAIEPALNAISNVLVVIRNSTILVIVAIQQADIH
jgi:hypothetical protein